MKVFERVVILIFIIGIILKAFSLIGGDTLVFVSLFTLSVFYFIFSIVILNKMDFKQIFQRQSYDNISSLRALYSMFCSVAFYSFLTGLMFRTFNWENATLTFWLGVLLLSVCLIISLIKYMQYHSTFYKLILLRIGVFVVFLLLYLLIHLTVGWAPSN